MAAGSASGSCSSGCDSAVVGHENAGTSLATGVLGCKIMTREAEKLLEVAATLPPAERAALVVRLLDSIAAPDDDVAAAQRSESRARLDAARDGVIDLVDDDDAMRMISG
jgi:putative addiction module component (TIGR02574 family)